MPFLFVSHFHVASETELDSYHLLESHTAQKMKFSIWNFFSNVTQFAENRGFGHIYWRNPYWKTFFVQCQCMSCLTSYQITASETELDSFHQKVNARVASTVNELHKTEYLRKWRNIREISKLNAVKA